VNSGGPQSKKGRGERPKSDLIRVASRETRFADYDVKAEEMESNKANERKRKGGGPTGFCVIGTGSVLRARGDCGARG